MKLCIITGSLREENTTRTLSCAFIDQATAIGIPCSHVSLNHFDQLFTGTYIYTDSATPMQRSELEKMSAATTLLFIVPTYYKSMPGLLKTS